MPKSQDMVLVWQPDSPKPLTHLYNIKEGKLSADLNLSTNDISFHPLNDYFAHVNKSGWSFRSMNGYQEMCSVSTTENLCVVEFHPDGLLLATGSDTGKLAIWDIR